MVLLTSVGSDRIPTFPPEPEPTECETKTASLCSTTTSYVVSTVEGTLSTISSHVPPPTCVKVSGCHVTGTSLETTVKTTENCPTATVTDVVVTCSGTGTSACSTKTAIPKTGCSITATTTTVSCTPAPSGKGRRQVSGDTCLVVEDYIVWPKKDAKREETTRIHDEMKKALGKKTKIVVSETRYLGVNFWRVTMDAGQAQRIREIPNVSETANDPGKRLPTNVTGRSRWYTGHARTVKIHRFQYQRLGIKKIILMRSLRDMRAAAKWCTCPESSKTMRTRKSIIPIYLT